MPSRRRWLWFGSALLLAAVAVRLTTWQGLLTAVRVSGGSMADALVGEHFCRTCADCGFHCRYDAHDPPGDGRVVCPNCGFIFDHPLQAAVQPGQRVWIDRLVYRFRQPARWEIVAFRTATGRLEVKRVVGLPGESVQIRGGEVYVDGRLIRKSLAQLRQLALLVHDNDYRLQSLSLDPPRWRPVGDSPAWRMADGQLRFDPQSASAGELAWVSYEHWPGFAGHLPPRQSAPILDNYGYNQNLSRPLQAVHDVLLVCRLTVPGRAGRVVFDVSEGGEVYRVVLDFQRRAGRLLCGPERLGEFELPAAAFARGVKIELAVCDRQVMFAVDDQLLVRREAREPANATGPAGAVERIEPRFRIGASGGSVTIDRLRVWRDIHYLYPGSADWPWEAPRPLGPAEVLVLGDNAPISEDSRHWSEPGIPLSDLLGRVLRASGGAARRP